jgi:hypothetical protein
MRKSLILIVILASASVSVLGQRSADDLILDGTIADISGYVDGRSGKDVFSFQISLYLQIQNKSEEPIIVFRVDRFLGQKKIEFLKSAASSQGEEVGAAKTLPWVNPAAYLDYDPFPRYIEQLKSSFDPNPQDLFVIQPGGYYEFRDIVTVDVGYDVDMAKLAEARKREAELNAKYFGDRESPKRIESLGSLRTSKFPFMRIEYSLSFKKYGQEADFLRGLQKRWKSVGNLYLNSDSDFSIKSQPIINQTPR